MATIHFILQGKGGVGKSMIAALLYQAATALGKSVEAFDTDPINATLAGDEGFTVTRIDVLDESGAIDPRKFDELMEGLAFSQCEHVIVDNGASSFVELGNYIKTGDMLKTLQEGGDGWSGHHVLLHTVITGGQAFNDTIKGLHELTASFPNQGVVVWVNPYFGKPPKPEGRSFGEFLSEKAPSIVSVIELPGIDARTGGVDLERVFLNHQTLAEAIAAGNIGTKSRLRAYWNTVRERIEESRVL